MKRLYLCLLGVLAAGGLRAEPRNYCKVCHSQAEVEFRESAHREELTCVSCHGGDAAAAELGQAHGRGFRGRISRSQIPAFCAECHADPERMRPFGLPTDQLALYQTSEHGRKFAQGEARVAVCTDCHHSHRILPSDDLNSPTHRQNIAATCGLCHADAARMAPFGMDAGVVAQYEASVHAQALRRGSAAQSPDCAGCHGSHGAAPPGVGDVSKVCTHCHRQTREFFRLGPHQPALAAGHQGECAACHGSHRILAPDRELWVSSCAPCHEPSSEEARTGEKILALFTQAEEEIDRARQTIDLARRIPLDVTDYELRLNSAASYLVEARPVSHSLDVEAVEELARKSRSVAQELQGEIHEEIRVFESRNLVVALVWLYILITILALQLYKRAAR